MRRELKHRLFKVIHPLVAEEVWKDIPGYEGSYQASNKGRVRSLDRIVMQNNGFASRKKGCILRPAPSSNNRYKHVQLASGAINKSYSVHTLIALAFFGPCPEGCEVDHINEKTKDNRVENLRYLSAFENRSRSVKGKFLKKCGNAMEHNPKTKSVFCEETGESYPCAKYLTKIYGTNYSSLRYHLQRGGVTINGKLYQYGIACH